jgi:uncharacterized protein GlcG (DUF336 family)
MLSHLNGKGLPALAIAGSVFRECRPVSFAPDSANPDIGGRTRHRIHRGGEGGGWPRVVAVVGSKGLPIILERMDDATVLADVELAPGKARAAALFRRESGALKGAVNGNRRAVITARSFVPMRGDIPLVIGAIGVSADTSDHDEQVARAGVAPLAQ